MDNKQGLLESGKEEMMVGIEFLNYENVCQAEKDILLNIIRGSDSQEYSKGLFAFKTPFNDVEDGGFEFGQGEGEGGVAGGISVAVPSQSSCANVAVVSAQPNGAVLTYTTIPPHAGMVTQTGPLHTVPTYYAGQGHNPIPVSATSAPIASVGPVSMASPSGNPVLMYAPMMQQQYYPGYYGPAGTNQPHLPPFVPLDNSISDNYMSPSQNHHKTHETHHPGPGPHQATAGQGTNTPYGKGRRKQQPPPPTQPPNYYYNPPPFYGVPAYYNQQQLQNVTGTPIYMGPGVYLPHHHSMYPHGPPPQGGEMEHHNMPPQPVVSIPSDMSFAQSPTGLPPPVFAHIIPSNSATKTANSVTVVKESGDSHPGGQATNVNCPPKSLSNPSAQDVLSSTCSDAKNDEEEVSKSSPGAFKPKFVTTNSQKHTVSGTNVYTAPSSAQSQTTSAPDMDAWKSKTSNKAFNGSEKESNSKLISDKKPSSMPKTADQIKDRQGPAPVLKGVADSILDSAGTDTRESVLVVAQVNGDITNKLSVKRDNLSAEHTAAISDVARKSYCSSAFPKPAGADTCSPVVTTTIVPEESKTAEETAATEPPKSNTNEQPNNKVNTVSRSWANIASVKTPNVSIDGANSRNNAQTNHMVGVSGSCSSSGSITSGAANVVPSQSEQGDRLVSPVPNDPIAFRLAEHLVKYTLDHQSVPLLPRGLFNQHNSCFVNAILQALMACPTFVNMFRALTPVLDKTPCKSALVIQNMFEFVREFTPLMRTSATKKDKTRDSFAPGPNLEATGVRKSLTTFKEEGRQEDAEEFLTSLLNSLHEEMLKVMKILEAPKDKTHDTINRDSGELNGLDDKGEEDDDDDQWQVMGAKNRSSVTRRTTVLKSPISEAFSGQLYVSLSRANALKKANVEPFFAVQLAIQGDHIKSVQDALDAISTKEEVKVSEGDSSEADALRQHSFEDLPPILILHLKRFIYEKDGHGGIRKVNKKLEYGVDLEIGKDLLSNNSKNKYSPKQRQYKLFAVVYHDGEDAHKGHYVADCFHPSGGSLWGNWGWLRYDDTSIKPISEASMLNPQHPRVPYLLLYRRQDTIIQQQSKKGSSS